MSIITADTVFGKISYFSNEEFIGKAFTSGSYWEISIIKKIAPLLQNTKGIVLDLGAHIGTHSIALAKLCPHLHFHCFEPQKSIFDLLKLNVHQNNLESRFTLHNVAVGHVATSARMSSTYIDGASVNKPVNYESSSPTNHGGLSLGTDGEYCTMITIDSLNLSNVVYVKMDIQGAEFLAIQGMQQTLKSKPIIEFEHDSGASLKKEVLENFGFTHALKTEELLKNLGYKIQKISHMDYLALP